MTAQIITLKCCSVLIVAFLHIFQGIVRVSVIHLSVQVVISFELYRSLAHLSRLIILVVNLGS